MNIQKNICLSQFTNWRIGGPVDYFVEVDSIQFLKEALDFAKENKIPYFILGGGTNLLVSDSGYRGIVIRNKMSDIRIVAYKAKLSNEQHDRKNVYVSASSGVLVNRLVRYTLDQGLSGLENFLGQPGTIGGAMYINAHNMSKNDYFGDHVVEANLITDEGEIKTKPHSYFDFGYDESKLQKSREIVTSVTVGLEKRSDEKKALWKKAEEAMQYRHRTQPKGFATAGCTFRNISQEDAKAAGVPNSIQSAGFLIDSCGLKGTQIGNAMISKEHANFILNLGEATAEDVKQLIDLCKNKVKEKYSIDLHEEIVLLGEF